MNIQNNIMFNSSFKITVLIIIGLCLFSPLMAADQGDSTNSADTTRCPVPDLRIQKRVDSTLASPGSILKYFLLITNKSETDSEDILVRDSIPVFTTYIQGSVSNNGNYSSTNNNVEWQIDMLPSGASIELMYEVLIDPSTPDQFEIRNTAEIVLPVYIPSGMVITWIKTGPRPRPEIVKQVDKTTAYPGDTLFYSLTVSNQGDAKAFYTDIIDEIPEYTTYLIGSATSGTYDAAFNKIDWYVQFLQPGEEADMSFAVIIDSDAPAQTEITNIGTIVQEIGNVADTVRTTVLASGAKLNVSKEVDKATANAGDTLTYTLRADNTGNVDNNSTTIIDDIPQYSYYIPGSETGGAIYNANENRIEWTGTVPAFGSTGDITFKVYVDKFTPPQTVIMNIGAIAQRANPIADTARTTIVPSPDPRMYIEKNVDKSIAYPGDTLTYELIVYNSGAFDAVDVAVKDAIPQHADYVPGSSVDGTYDSGLDQLSWSVGLIEAYQDVRFTFKVVIENRVPGNTTIVNKGSVTAPGPPDSDLAKTKVLANPNPRLFIEKEVNKATAYPGDTLTYDLTIGNSSKAAAKNINVIDNIPEFTTFITGSAASGSYDTGLNQLSWTIDRIESQQDYSLSFQVIIDEQAPAPLTINNVGTVTSHGRTDSDDAKTEVLVHPGPKVYIDKSVNKATAYNGDTLTYYLDISNYGGEAAENAKVTDNIPEHTTYIPGSAIGGSYDVNLNQVSWDLPYVPQGMDVSMLQFKVVIDRDLTAATTIINTGTVTYDDTSDSDDASTEVSIHPGPKVYIDKSVNKATAYNGDTLTYYLDISNYGGEAAENAKVTDNIPEHTTYIPGSAIGGSYDANLNQVSWDLPYVPQGMDVSMLQFKVVIDRDLTAATTIVNIGTVTYGEESDYDDASTEVSIHPGPKIYIDKSVNKATAYNGDTLIYYLDIYNYGSEPAENVQVTDIIPEHTTFIPGSAIGASYDATLNQLTWNLSSLSNGFGGAYLQFKVVIDRSLSTPTTIVNTGEVDFEDQYDSDDAKTEVSVHPGPKVYIDKSVNKVTAYNGDTLTYYLDISNYGGEAAENAKVTDNIPEHTTYIPGSAIGGSYDANLNQVSWDLPYVPQGMDVSMLQFKVVIDRDLTVATTIINTGTVSYNDTSDSDDAKTEVSIHPGPKVYIDKGVNKATANPGDTLTYYLDISNYGGETAENVLVTDVIPPHTTYIQGSATSGGSYDAALNRLTWNLSTVPQGTDVVYLRFEAVIDKRVVSATTIVNVGTVTYDDQSHSDDAKTNVSASPVPRLYIEKQVSDDLAYPGDTLTYTLIVWNGSEVTAENISVIDNIPEHTTYISGTAFGGSYDANLDQLSWTIGALDAGQETYLSFRAIIDDGTAGQTIIRNIGTVTAPGIPDLDETTTTVLAYPGPKLYIEKRVDETTAYAGDTLLYTLIVSNSSSTVAENVNVEDYIPSYTTYVPGSSFGASYDDGSELLTWTVDYIEAGDPAYLSFKAVIDKDTPDNTDIINIGSIVLPDSKLSDDVKTTVLPSPTSELTIDKKVDKVTAYAGDTLIYTLDITNIGEETARNVKLEDYIPEHTSYVIGSASDGTYDETNNLLTWLVDIIEPGETVSRLFKMIIDSATPEQTEIVNTGSIVLPDGKKSDDATTTILATPEPTLKITKTVNKPTAYVGDTLTYTVVVSNIGEVSETNVEVEDFIPEYTTYLPDVSSALIYDANTGRLSWIIDNLNSGATSTTSFNVLVNAGTPDQTKITNIGSILFPDESKLSDTAETIVQTGPSPDLDITKTVDKAAAYAGDTLTYTISISNSGDVADEDVWITDPIPQNATYIDGSVTGGGDYNSTSATVSWNIAVPAGGTSSDLNFRVLIDIGTQDQTTIRNIGSILLPDESKLSDTAETVVQTGPSSDLDIIKAVDKAAAYAGDTLTYTISISNSGEAADEDVWVSDPIPQNATYIDGSITGGGIYDTQTEIIDWNISVPAGGSSPDLTFKVFINENTQGQTVIENIGSILFPDESKLSDTAATTVLEIPTPDIEITKEVDSLIASPGSILTYSLEFTNTGNTPITQITAWDKLPEFTSYIDGSATAGGIYNETDNQINWDWQVGSIAPGHSIDLFFKVKIDDAANEGTQITNVGHAALPVEQFEFIKAGSVQYEIIDTVNSNPVTTVVDIKTGEDDLTIFKEVSDTYTAPGNVLTYELTVTNTGTETLNDIVFVDTIPNLTTYRTGSATGGATYDGTEKSLTWTVGTLTQGQSVKYQFSVTVDIDAPEAAVISNQGFIIEPTVIDGNIVKTTVLGEMILVVKSVDKYNVTTGDTLTYTITYTNNSLTDVDNFVIADTIPDGLNYVTGSVSTYGLYNPINNTIIWRIPTIPSGGSGSVHFSVVIDESVPNADQIENFVIFYGNDIPIDTSNLVIVTITFPEMLMSKAVDQVITIPGDTVTYTINSFNDGAGPLNNAVIIDTLPENFEYVSGTATVNGTAATVTGTNILSISIGTMEAGESAEIVYDVAILEAADRSTLHINTARMSGTTNSGQPREFGPVQAIVSLQTPRLMITKRADATSAMAGSFVPYTITVTNVANIAVDNVVVTDSMASGFFYVDGSSILNGATISDPVGTNPYNWLVGTIGSGQTITLQYMTQLGTSVPSGPAENTAWAAGTAGGDPVRTINVVASVNVISSNIPGAIRGKIIVNCNNDGKADADSILGEIDIYLDDGSHSKVNEKGMFYFSTVRAGEHVVAIDVRDLINYDLAEGQDGSVLVYVHEAGESYVLFRICPTYPKLNITKEAAILPKIKVSKTANLNDSMITDSNGVNIDYDVLIESSFGVPPGEVVVVDSFPDETRKITIYNDETGQSSDTGKVLRYVIDSPGGKRIKQSVYYSLDDEDAESDHFLTNNLYLESIVNVETKKSTPIKSAPIELSVGPFNAVSAGEMEIGTIVAHFITAKAFLQDFDLPKIAEMADSIRKYPDFDIKVEGHCDYRRIHTKRFPSNWELSDARAQSVINRFVEFHGFDRSMFTYEGFAATRPIDTGHTEASWWKNRRAEVILSGSLKGGFEFTGDLNQKWSQSTLMELEPIKWDTLLFASEAESETDLINSWEVLITVDNIGPGKASKVVIEDLLPAGAVYEEGSASVNGHKISANLDANNNLVIGSGDIPEGNSIKIRYRIQADKNTTITGGGKAIIEIEHPDLGTVKQESNPIRFY